MYIKRHGHYVTPVNLSAQMYIYIYMCMKIQIYDLGNSHLAFKGWGREVQIVFILKKISDAKI